MLEMFVNVGADTNASYYGSWTPLLQCTVRDDKQMVRSLLKHGANLSPKVCKERNILHFAIEFHSDCRMVELLLKKGARAFINTLD